MAFRACCSSLLIMTCVLAGCDKPRTTTGSAIMVIGEMKVIVEGVNPSVTSDGRAVTATVAGMKAIIQPDEVLVDGITRATIPPDTKTVRILVRDNALVVELDGKEASKAAK